MSYIIVHVDDSDDLNSMDILPNEEGKGVKIFDSQPEASHFLMEMGFGKDLWFNSDIHIMRLH
jgi:hypothetical protein